MLAMKNPAHRPSATTARPSGLMLALFAACAAALASAPAAARHNHRHSEAARSAGIAGQFDYYLLTLSWSPTYCLTHSDDQAQCGSKGYGFVLHGLWPQYQDGGYPEYCGADAPLSAAAGRVGESLFPSPRLVGHEWDRHGRCSGLDALDYFRTADRALAVVQVPPALQTPRQSLLLSAAQVRAAFRSANPTLEADGLAIACTRNELSEVRVCLDRQLRWRSCGRGVRDSCPRGALRIPASR
jgi:ribonuclease T2